MKEQDISDRLRSIHRKLLQLYGPLHWWPAETKLEIIIGAILTQNTNWQNVVKAIKNLKREGLLNASALFHIKEEFLA